MTERKATGRWQLIVAPTTVGMVVGATAALVWHVAVPAGVSASIGVVSAHYEPALPGWWPSLVLLPLAGAGVGAIVAAGFSLSGWRIRRELTATRRPLLTAAACCAVVLGGSFALIWSVWPPPDTYAVAHEFQQFEDRYPTPEAKDAFCRLPNVVCAAVEMTPDRDSEIGVGTLVEPPRRVPIGIPLVTFSLLSAVATVGVGFMGVRCGYRLVRSAARPTT